LNSFSFNSVGVNDNEAFGAPNAVRYETPMDRVPVPRPFRKKNDKNKGSKGV
jgi:hypothetical protein